MTGSGYASRIKYTEKRKRLFFAVNQAKAAFLCGARVHLIRYSFGVTAVSCLKRRIKLDGDVYPMEADISPIVMVFVVIKGCARSIRRESI